jgi:hypothetical protein
VTKKKKVDRRNLKKLMHSLIHFHIDPLVFINSSPGSYFLTTDSILTPLHSITIIEIHPYGFTRCPLYFNQTNFYIEIFL